MKHIQHALARVFCCRAVMLESDFFMGVHANDFQEQQGAEKAKDLHEEVQAYGCVCV